MCPPRFVHGTKQLQRIRYSLGLLREIRKTEKEREGGWAGYEAGGEGQNESRREERGRGRGLRKR